MHRSEDQLKYHITNTLVIAIYKSKPYIKVIFVLETNMYYGKLLLEYT